MKIVVDKLPDNMEKCKFRIHETECDYTFCKIMGDVCDPNNCIMIPLAEALDSSEPRVVLNNTSTSISKFSEEPIRDGYTRINIQAEMKDRWVNTFLSFLKCLEYNGNLGHTGVVGIMSDGDGDFRPKFKFDTEYKHEPGVWEHDLEEKAFRPGTLEVLFDADFVYGETNE